MQNSKLALVAALAASGLRPLDATCYAIDGILPVGSDLRHERIALANDSRFNESYFSRPLTAFAVGYRDTSDLEGDLEFIAPRVPVNRRFDYEVWSNAEEFYSETTDDLRSIKGDFKQVEYTSTKVNGKTENRGLTIRVDLDEVAEKNGWEERYTSKLIRRLRRNALRRASALLSAAATNTAKTWDVTAGKDPDQDVNAELITAADISGVRPNRVFYGETAWSKRLLAHRAQNSAGGFASAGQPESAVAQFLAVEGVRYSRARYQSSSSAKTQIIANLVLMYQAMSGADVEDPSNIKRFVSPTASGGDMRVYTQQISAKIYEITVEHYELLKIVSTLGIRKFTVS
jgi:hypothetical protein